MQVIAAQAMSNMAEQMGMDATAKPAEIPLPAAVPAPTPASVAPPAVPETNSAAAVREGQE